MCVSPGLHLLHQDAAGQTASAAEQNFHNKKLLSNHLTAHRGAEKNILGQILAICGDALFVPVERILAVTLERTSAIVVFIRSKRRVS